MYWIIQDQAVADPAAGPVVEEKTEFDTILTSYGDKKILIFYK